MDQGEFERCCTALGVVSDFSLQALDRAFLKKNLALIRTGTPEERAQLRADYEQLANHLKTRPSATIEGGGTHSAGGTAVNRTPIPPAASQRPQWSDHDREWSGPFSFESRTVNLVALPVVALAAGLINLSPLGFFLRGFQVWIHEFGHATVAWLTGKRALPLPIGWTNVEGERSLFVYFGVLFLLGVLSVAGWKERKIWPMLIAATVAPLQFYMTWRMPEYRGDMWLSFGGVGGEFYLSALLMVLFYFQLPEKFRWGGCRYVFLFLGAGCFTNSYLFWHRVKRGAESIPWGSMINGEEDGGGDMNVLRDVYHWNNHEIVGAYTRLGDACLWAVLIVYLIFALRLDHVAGRLVNALWPE